MKPWNIDLSTAITIGNHTYFPLNILGSPADITLVNVFRGDNVENILSVLNTFEEKHPELKVIHWRIERQQGGFLTNPIILGLWIDHEPRK